MPQDVARLLPESLASRSLASGEVILPPDAALEAVEHLTRDGHRIESWEGVLRFADGSRTRSLEHPGVFTLPADPAEAARRARDGIEAAHARWQRAPEHPTAELFIHVVLAAAGRTAQS